MARSHVQISAIVSSETKDLIERFSRATGIKKGRLLESAVLHHIRALEELPADAIIPPRIVVSKKTGEDIAAMIEKPRAPTPAMKEMMGGD